MTKWPAYASSTLYPGPGNGLRVLTAPFRGCPGPRAFDGAMPVRDQAVALLRVHPRLVPRGLTPHRVHLGQVPDPGADPGQVGRADSRGFRDLGHDDRRTEHVRLKLHEPAILDRAPVRLELPECLAGRRLLRSHCIDGLVSDGLERGARQVRASVPPREADDGPSRVGIPIGRTEPRKGRDEIDAVVAVE